MPKIILSGYIVVPDREVQEICEALSAHVSLTRQEPGCIKFDVLQRKGSPNIFDVYEEFISEEAFEFHQNRVKESLWGEVSANVERHYSVKESYE